jgi:hypothetical protein
MLDEEDLERHVRDCPNLIAQGINRSITGYLGQEGVCLEQVALDSGVLDLAFIGDSAVGDTVIHLMECKDITVSQKTAIQCCGYGKALQRHYPNHQIKGYLIGRYCPDRENLRLILKSMPYDMEIKTAPKDFPLPGQARQCRECGRCVALTRYTCQCGSSRFL